MIHTKNLNSHFSVETGTAIPLTLIFTKDVNDCHFDSLWQPERNALFPVIMG